MTSAIEQERGQLRAQLAECKAVCEKINAEQQDIIRQCKEAKAREHHAADTLLAMSRERDGLARQLNEVAGRQERMIAALSEAVNGRAIPALRILAGLDAVPRPRAYELDDDPPESEP
jgi:uncharacterized coiled-coil DUF342 family protein